MVDEGLDLRSGGIYLEKGGLKIVRLIVTDLRPAAVLIVVHRQQSALSQVQSVGVGSSSGGGIHKAVRWEWTVSSRWRIDCVAREIGDQLGWLAW